MKKPELLSPAGDLEKLKIAIQYGADAVYASTPKFSMRTREVGFDNKSLAEGIEFTHSVGKKIYLTLNVFPHANEIEEFKKHAETSFKLRPDAIIAADPGIVDFILSNSDIPVHLSTQASTTNQLSAEFWYKIGVSRIVLARELSLKDISILHQQTEVEIEAFVHGAMCMAYSGRCQISNYLVGRDPNRGECVQPCRFKYRLYDLKEDLRPEESYQIYEDDRGSYILNSKYLCMIEHVPELIEAGISSFKIEGRLKSIYYVGTVTKAYREAIDLFFENPNFYQEKKSLFKTEVEKTSNRGFTTGFYFSKPDKDTNNYESSRSIEKSKFIGLVEKSDGKKITILAKNHFEVGDNTELVTPEKTHSIKIEKITKNNEDITAANPNYLIEIPCNIKAPKNSFLRTASQFKN